jgi:hypothetical protein
MKSALIVAAVSIASLSAALLSDAQGETRHPRLTAAQWNRKLQSLPQGMPLSEIVQTIHPKRVYVFRTYTSSGGMAELTLDSRYAATVAIEPKTQRMIFIAPVERIHK